MPKVRAFHTTTLRSTARTTAASTTTTTTAATGPRSKRSIASQGPAVGLVATDAATSRKPNSRPLPPGGWVLAGSTRRGGSGVVDGRLAPLACPRPVAAPSGYAGRDDDGKFPKWPLPWSASRARGRPLRKRFAVGHKLAVQRPDGNAHGGPSPTSDLAAMPPDASP
jgi:hypothetical protein